MAKKSKGFGTPPPSKKKTSTKKTKPPLPKHIELAPLADTEFLEDKEKRLQQIWNSTQIPEVSMQSLAIMHQALHQGLSKNFPLNSKEPFPWEINYVYGTGDIKEHQKNRASQASYEDAFKFQSVSTQISMKTGIQIQIERIEDGQSFAVPLINLEAAEKESPEYQAIADYQLWWSDYQPTFP